MAVAQRLLDFRPVAELRTDRSLVRSAQSGRRDAAAALIERYYPKVRSFVSYLVGGSANVDDMTQEVFTRALAALPRFNGNYRFGPWVYRIAKNLCIDEARRNNFRPEPADPAELPFLESKPGASDYVWESISSQMASSMVRRALARLPWRQRAALMLKELEGMSYLEISQVIGSGVRGVEATLRRARSNFRLAVARVEESDLEKASCMRTLRLVAGDTQSATQTRKHLRSCPDCRSRASEILAADKLLGMLPPIAFGAPAWKSELVQRVAYRQVPKRGLMESLRGHPTVGLLSPFAQVAQYAASLAVAASVSVASVSGVVRVGFSAGAPAATEVASGLDASSEATRNSRRLSLSSEFEGQNDSQPVSVLDQARLVEGLDSTLVTAAADLQLQRIAGVAKELAGTVDGSSGGLESQTQIPDAPVNGASEVPGVPSIAVLPAPVLMPRRRPSTT